MSTQENVQVVKDFFAAMGSSNKQHLLSLVAEDVEWIIPGENWPLAGTHRGIAGLQDVLRKASEGVETQYPESPEFVAQGDRVFVIGVATGKIKETNKAFKDDWVFDITVKSGKVTKIREYIDTQALARASEMAPSSKSSRKGKILVTGASGHLGRKTLQHLLKRRPASELVGLARDPEKAADLAAQGIEIRQGDYFDFDSLVKAFEDVEKVLLISSAPFTDRNTQHYNGITAARQAGVKHVVYTPIIRREGSGFILSQCTSADIFAEQTLMASGLTFTIVRQPPFLETFQFQFGDKVYEKGLRVPPGDGREAPASREDIAEAQAVVLTEEGHDNKIYSLSGDSPVSYADIAQILSETRGATVPVIPVTDEQYIANYIAEGLPEPFAAFALEWVHGTNIGEWGEVSGDLERLIGRRPMTTADYLRDNYPTVVASIEAAKGN